MKEEIKQKEKCFFKDHLNTDAICYCPRCDIYMCKKCVIVFSIVKLMGRWRAPPRAGAVRWLLPACAASASDRRKAHRERTQRPLLDINSAFFRPQAADRQRPNAPAIQPQRPSAATVQPPATERRPGEPWLATNKRTQDIPNNHRQAHTKPDQPRQDVTRRADRPREERRPRTNEQHGTGRRPRKAGGRKNAEPQAPLTQISL